MMQPLEDSMIICSVIYIVIKCSATLMVPQVIGDSCNVSEDLSLDNFC